MQMFGKDVDESGGNLFIEFFYISVMNEGERKQTECVL
jgi:hypothetical protein